MQLLIILMIPTLLALSFVFTGRRNWRIDCGIIILILIVELFTIGNSSSTWDTKSKVAFNILVLIFPWLACGIYVVFSKKIKSNLMYSFVYLFIYVMTMAIGLAFGDMSGLISQ